MMLNKAGGRYSAEESITVSYKAENDKINNGPAQGEGEQNPDSPLTLPSVEVLEAELKKVQHKSNFGRVFRNTVFLLLVAAAAAALIAVLVLPVLQVNGTSMGESLKDKDVVIALSGSGYNTGDIIAFYYNNNILIKRVIATSGDWVDMDEDGNVYVNDELLDESYIKEKAVGYCNIDMPYQVPEGKCFVMGDNRATSIDSRNTVVGCVGSDMILGKIFFRVWPLPELGSVK